VKQQVTCENIIETITSFIKKSYQVPENDPNFNEHVNLFEEGYIDSLGLVKFISFLENQFNIRWEEEYLYDERFMTISGQKKMIQALLES